MNQPVKKYCRIYTRVSTVYQKELGVSLEAQEKKCQAFALLNNYEVKQIYTDAGISGKTLKKRPGILRLLDDLEEGDLVLFYSLSRLARSVKETLVVMDILQKKKCHLASCSENLCTDSPMGTFIFQLFASLAELESNITSERVKLGMSLKQAKGEFVGRPPYGFKVKDKVLIPDKKEQENIKVIIEIREQKNRFGRPTSLIDIVKELKRRKIKPRETCKKGWHINTIARILRTHSEKEKAEEDIKNIKDEESDEEEKPKTPETKVDSKEEKKSIPEGEGDEKTKDGEGKEKVKKETPKEDIGDGKKKKETPKEEAEAKEKVKKKKAKKEETEEESPPPSPKKKHKKKKAETDSEEESPKKKPKKKKETSDEESPVKKPKKKKVQESDSEEEEKPKKKKVETESDEEEDKPKKKQTKREKLNEKRAEKK